MLEFSVFEHGDSFRPVYSDDSVPIIDGTWIVSKDDDWIGGC